MAGLRGPVNASAAPSRAPPHDSGPGWFANPFLYRTFIDYSLPVSWRTVLSPLPRHSHWRHYLVIRPVIPAFPERVVGSACALAFSRLSQRSLAFRPAHSRCHQLVACLPEGFRHFVTSMSAPVASGWSGCRVGLAPTGKRRLFTAHTHSCRTEFQIDRSEAAVWLGLRSRSDCRGVLHRPVEGSASSETVVPAKPWESRRSVFTLRQPIADLVVVALVGDEDVALERQAVGPSRRRAPPRSSRATRAPRKAMSRSGRRSRAAPSRTTGARPNVRCLDLTADFGRFADAKKCPDCFRHCAQWQAVADVGATANSKRMLPQWQEPLSPSSVSTLGACRAWRGWRAAARARSR